MLTGMAALTPVPAPASASASAATPMRFAVSGCAHAPLLSLPRAAALDLLEWLGLGRPEFGAIDARALGPLCRRRLWTVRRNEDARLRALTEDLLAVTVAADGALVLFG